VSKHLSVRLTEQLAERISAIAESKGVSFSAATRFALERGVAAMEKDAQPPARPARRIISKGVGF
jgi:predicted DNA-binding protein